MKKLSGWDAVLLYSETPCSGPSWSAGGPPYFPPAPAEWLFRWLASKDGQNKVLNIPISNVAFPREQSQSYPTRRGFGGVCAPRLTRGPSSRVVAWTQDRNSSTARAVYCPRGDP